MSASDAFVEEATEQAAALAAGMVELDPASASAGAPTGEDGARARVDVLFRHAHNLKGMAAMEGIEAVQLLAHAAEDLLDHYRRDGAPPPTAAEAADLVAAADAIATMVDQVAGGGEATARPELVASLRARADTRAGAGPEERADGSNADAADPTGSTGASATSSGAELGAAGATALVEVVLADDCALPGARATVVLRQAGRAATVVGVVPSREVVTGGGATRFTLGLGPPEGGPLDAEALASRLRTVPDVAEVSVDDVPDEPVVAPRPAAPTDSATGTTTASSPTDASPADPGVAAPAATAVRVDVSRLDALMDLAGELVIERNRLEAQARRLGDRGLHEAVTGLRRSIADLQLLVQRVRRVPIEPVFARLQRLVRDTARELGKPVTLTVEGEATEVDRSAADAILQPLVHLLRNAVDHGIEPVAERVAAGKPEQATIALRAAVAGDSVVFEVADDGGGLDLDGIRATALRRGLVDEARAEALGRDEIVELLFQPGFSTSGSVGLVSGRGVGLDVVRATVNRLGGSVDVRSTPGQGTTFRVRLPRSLVVMDALLVRVADECWALPLGQLLETVALPDGPHPVAGRHLDRAVPVVDGAVHLGAGTPTTGPAFGLVLQTVGRPQLLVVDELLGHAEVVVRPCPLTVPGLDHLAGVALLGDGRVALVLDVAALLDGAGAATTAEPRQDAGVDDAPFRSALDRAATVVEFYTRQTCAPTAPGPHPPPVPEAPPDPAPDPVSGPAPVAVSFELGGAWAATLVFEVATPDGIGALLGLSADAPGELVDAAVDEFGNMLGSQFVAALADEHGLSVTLSVPHRGPDQLGGRANVRGATLHSGPVAIRVLLGT